MFVMNRRNMATFVHGATEEKGLILYSDWVLAYPGATHGHFW
jgi:hypothetical protein